MHMSSTKKGSTSGSFLAGETLNVSLTFTVLLHHLQNESLEGENYTRLYLRRAVRWEMILCVAKKWYSAKSAPTAVVLARVLGCR